MLVAKGVIRRQIPRLVRKLHIPRHPHWLAWHLQADLATTSTATAAANRRSVTNVCRAVFCRRVSLAPRKRVASLSVCEADGLESASVLTGHASCLTTQRATAVPAAKHLHPFRGTNHVEKKLDRLRVDVLTPP